LSIGLYVLSRSSKDTVSLCFSKGEPALLVPRRSEQGFSAPVQQSRKGNPWQSHWSFATKEKRNKKGQQIGHNGVMIAASAERTDFCCFASQWAKLSVAHTDYTGFALSSTYHFHLRRLRACAYSKSSWRGWAVGAPGAPGLQLV